MSAIWGRNIFSAFPLRRMLNHKAKNDDIFLHSRKMNACFSLSPSPLSWTKNGEMGKTHRFSPTKFLFRPTFAKFQGKKTKFQGKKSEKCPTKLHKQHVTFSKRHVVSSQTSASFEKTSHNRAKTTEICDFQSHWESRISQQLFLSSYFRVKWRSRKCKQIANSKTLSQIDH